jgi:hypothetical protein
MLFLALTMRKGVIRNRISKKDRQNGNKKGIKRQKNGLLQTAQKTKDKATQSPLKNGGELKSTK